MCIRDSLIDADANAVGCLRVFAAAAQAQAEAGTLEDEGRDDQDEDAEIRRDIGLLEQDRACLLYTSRCV